MLTCNYIPQGCLYKNGYQQKTGIILMSIVNKHIFTQIKMLCINQKNKNNRKACFIINQLDSEPQSVMCDVW